MQYVSVINKNFKKKYDLYQKYLKKKSEMDRAKEILAINSLLLSQNNGGQLKQLPQINASSIFKPKLNKQKTKNLANKVLKKKKTKNFNVLLDNQKESFLITQSEIINEKSSEEIQQELVTTKPFLKLFEEKKFLKEKILEAIEKVKFEKKWIA